MDSLVTIFSFILVLGVIVFVHEAGHYMVAKLFGVRVLTFSLGFGRKIWGFERGGTDYRVSLLPLGGYVRMAGEMPEERSIDPGNFQNKPRWQRILVYLAGPAMNVVLSVTVIAGVFMYGIGVQGLQEAEPVVGQVLESSAAERAGLRADDRILSIDGEPVELWNDLDFQISTSPEKTMRLGVLRDGSRIEVDLVPDKDPRRNYGDAGLLPRRQLHFFEVLEDRPAARAGFLSGDVVTKVDGQAVSSIPEFVDLVVDKADQEVAIEVLRDDALETIVVVPEMGEDGQGKIGVQLSYYRPLPPLEALHASVLYNLDIVDKTLEVLGKLFTYEIAPKSALSGPIEIAVVSGQAARMGFEWLIFLMGFLSISIGLMNLLPIPVLDGGHIAILLVESALRRDLSVRVKERFTQLGFVFLMMLMAVVIFFDLSKNLPLGGG